MVTTSPPIGCAAGPQLAGALQKPKPVGTQVRVTASDRDIRNGAHAAQIIKHTRARRPIAEPEFCIFISLPQSVIDERSLGREIVYESAVIGTKKRVPAENFRGRSRTLRVQT